MTTVKEIEEAIQHLPADKLAQLRSWFEEFDSANWDKQLEEDTASGKLDSMADKALQALKDDRCSEL